MNTTIILRGPPQAHRLWTLLKSNWQAMAHAGTPLAVTITEAKSKRSTDQNKMLHAVLQTIADQVWSNGRQYPMETWKELARRKFIGTEEIELPDGTRMERGISTTTLTVAECQAFIERVQAWAVTDLGCEL